MNGDDMGGAVGAASLGRDWQERVSQAVGHALGEIARRKDRDLRAALVAFGLEPEGRGTMLVEHEDWQYGVSGPGLAVKMPRRLLVAEQRWRGMVPPARPDLARDEQTYEGERFTVALLHREEAAKIPPQAHLFEARALDCQACLWCALPLEEHRHWAQQLRQPLAQVHAELVAVRAAQKDTCRDVTGLLYTSGPDGPVLRDYVASADTNGPAADVDTRAWHARTLTGDLLDWLEELRPAEAASADPAPPWRTPSANGAGRKEMPALAEEVEGAASGTVQAGESSGGGVWLRATEPMWGVPGLPRGADQRTTVHLAAWQARRLAYQLLDLADNDDPGGGCEPA